MHLHHIIPKHEWKKRFGSLKGVNSKDNVVFLTPEQHAQVHKFLYELNGCEYDRIASLTIMGHIGREDLISEIISVTHKGKPKTKEHNKKNSDANMGHKRNVGTNNSFYGLRHSDKSKNLIGNQPESRRKRASERMIEMNKKSALLGKFLGENNPMSSKNRERRK